MNILFCNKYKEKDIAFRHRRQLTYKSYGGDVDNEDNNDSEKKLEMENVYNQSSDNEEKEKEIFIKKSKRKKSKNHVINKSSTYTYIRNKNGLQSDSDVKQLSPKFKSKKKVRKKTKTKNNDKKNNTKSSTNAIEKKVKIKDKKKVKINNKKKKNYSKDLPSNPTKKNLKPKEKTRKMKNNTNIKVVKKRKRFGTAPKNNILHEKAKHSFHHQNSIELADIDSPALFLAASVENNLDGKKNFSDGDIDDDSDINLNKQPSFKERMAQYQRSSVHIPYTHNIHTYL